jgi:hypothetical protein
MLPKETPREREKRLDRERSARRRETNSAYVRADNDRRALADKERRKDETYRLADNAKHALADRERRKDEGYRLADNARHAAAIRERRKTPNNYGHGDAISGDSYSVPNIAAIADVPKSARFVNVQGICYKFRTKYFGVCRWPDMGGAVRLTTRLSEELWVIPKEYSTRSVYVDDERRFLWLTKEFWAAKKLRDDVAEGIIDSLEELRDEGFEASERWFTSEGLPDRLGGSDTIDNSDVDDDSDEEPLDDDSHMYEGRGDCWEEWREAFEERHNCRKDDTEESDSNSIQGEHHEAFESPEEWYAALEPMISRYSEKPWIVSSQSTSAGPDHGGELNSYSDDSSDDEGPPALIYDYAG